MSATTDTRQVRLIQPQSAEAVIAHYYEKSWGMVIGINDYQGEHPALANARNDAVAFADLLRVNYKFDEVFTFYDHEATCDTLMDWLRDKLPAQIGKNDRLVIFFAGHGTTRESGRGEKRGYLIPHDAQAGKYADYIDMTELRDACGWIRAKHILLVLDCCFSGVAAIASRAAPPVEQRVMTDAYLQEITRRSAWQVLTAGASDELAADSGSRPGHSAFTSALLAGLEGQADQNGDGIITASELAGFVKPEVSRQSMGGRARGQTPFFNYLAGSDQGDFVFLRHDTAIKIQRAATTIMGLPTTRLSPTIIGLGLVLLVAVGVLSWLVWGALARNDEIAQRLASYEATAAAAAAATAIADEATLVAANDAPPVTQTAIAAQQTASAIEVETRVAATSAAIAAGDVTPDGAAKQPVAPIPPTTTPTPPLPTATTPAQRQATAFLYEASAGDTWATVATRYGMTVAELKNFNGAWLECVTGLNTACRTEPKAGDDLLIPSLTGETLIGRGTTYTIRAGENLFRIGVRTGYTVATLVQANQAKIPNPGSLRSGTALYIPLPAELATPADCALVSNPPLQVGDHGVICLANGSDLGLRDGAGSGGAITRLKNGTAFKVVGGPECAYYSYANRTYFWWQVETTDGQNGWLVDGGDTKGDPVYLCRVDQDEHSDDPTPTPTPVTTTGEETAERISSEVVQAITNYWSLWGETAGCLSAWDMLTDSFKRNSSGLTQASYLENCGRNQVTVTQVYDLDEASPSVIEQRGQCALVRVQLDFNGLSDMTFGLLQSDPRAGAWQIQVARTDHAEARSVADAVCN